MSIDKPDKEIEEVWYGIKTAVKNISNFQFFFTGHFDIDKMSINLNTLQSREAYDDIEKCIQTYISQICIGYVCIGCSKYECHILDTHIKRWNKVAQNYTFFIEHDIRTINKYINIFYIYIKYLNYKQKIGDLDNYFNTITPDNLDILHLLDLSIKYRYPYFLDKLNNCCDIIKHINDRYALNIRRNTKGHKILARIPSRVE